MASSKVSERREVVVTGIGMMTPLGDQPADILRRYHAGESAFREITLYATRGSAIKYAGEHAAPDLKRLPDRKNGKILNRRDATSVLAAMTAFKAARLDEAKYEPHRLGMFVGSSCTHLGDLTPTLPLVAKHADFAGGRFDSAAFGLEFMETLNPILVLKLLMNNAVCFGTISLQIKGVNSNFMQQEVSGLRALGEGYLAIAEGRADAVLAGGTAQPVEPFQIYEAHHCGWLADQTVPGFVPERAARPYDQTANGTIFSESTAFLVLEDGVKARARGATILGRVCGFGIAGEGEPDSARPDGPATGVVRAFKAAMTQAQTTIEKLGAVYGNGSGIAVSDLREGLAMRMVLGDRLGEVPFCSVKGGLGDTAEAHGAVSTALALAGVTQGVVPATRNFATPPSALVGLQLASTTQTLKQPLTAIVSRSRFGVSAVLLVEAATPGR